jgi:hypothetical protein
VGGVFLALGGLLWWREHLLAAQVAGVLGGLLLMAGTLIPARLGPVYRAWMGLAILISKFTTPVFMGLVYYLVITPTGLIRRTVGSSQIVHVPSDGSYWKRREDGRRKSTLERQF